MQGDYFKDAWLGNGGRANFANAAAEQTVAAFWQGVSTGLYRQSASIIAAVCLYCSSFGAGSKIKASIVLIKNSRESPAILRRAH